MSKADVKVARRYAQALFDNCHADRYDDLSAALHAIAEAIQQPELKDALLDPSVKQSVRIGWLREIVAHIFSDESQAAERTCLCNMFETLVENRRIGLLPELAGYFSGLVAAFKKLMQLEVVTAGTLSPQELDQLGSQIKAKMPAEYASQVSIDWKTEKDLIGGMQVRIGDKPLDGSITGALDRIARELKGS